MAGTTIHRLAPRDRRRQPTAKSAASGRGPLARIGKLLALLALAYAVSVSPTSAVNWKSTVDFPDDPYAVPSANDKPGWIKFIVKTSDLDTAYFQDSNLYPFHYDFATTELPPFIGMSPAEFDAVSLHEAGQLAIMGSLILPPLIGGVHSIPEYGIQLVREDPYDPLLVRDLFNLIRASVVAGPEVEAFYFPSFEQQESAEQNAEFFAGEGITISSTARWATGNACYSHGWALGQMKFFEASQIDAAYLSGELDPGDVLLTDAVPAEIPFVAGVVTLSPSTPSSHVAILAQTFNIPFAHLALAADAQRAQDLVGRLSVLRVDDVYGSCRVRLIDAEGQLDPPTIASILALKDPPPLNISAVQPYGAYSASTDGLAPSDIAYFGGKAANFGLLRQSIAANSPVATAFSFDLWSSFMDRQVAGDHTLREEIAQRLSAFSYPPDMSALAAVLAGIQGLIKDPSQTTFDPAAEAAVLATLQDPQYGFDPNSKLRFRSSTNVEDSEQFTGAGLYDSYNGCLADELDGDESGPSICDPGHGSERGVFRAIRKVFASFYNTNAYLERLRHGIDENDVGMALLVHHSFPDENELANGVGTLTQSSPSNRSAYLVTQDGASSVTNPEPGAIAEEVDVYISVSGSIWPTLIRQSNLVPLGAKVMVFPADYEALTGLLLLVADDYQADSGFTEFTLEFEYKKMAPGAELIVKQVRRIPRTNDTPSVTPFLINEPTEYCLFQGEYGDVFANHRLKSRWTIETLNLWLSETNLQQSFYDETTLDYSEVCQLYQQSGPLPLWPAASHVYSQGVADDSWSFANLQNPRTYRLSASGIPELVAPSESPLLVLTDFGWPHDYTDLGCLELQVDYDRAVPSVDWTGPIMTTTDFALLCRCREPVLGDLLQQRSFVDPDRATIDTTFYWPPEEDIAAGYTAPLSRFVETVITGLTSTPIVLHGEHSQTYRPEHHNFGEHFLFEPALEPGLPPQQRSELEAANIRAIHVFFDFGGEQFTYYDDDAWGDGCLDCSGFDGDRDGYCTGEPDLDCDDAAAEVWAVPGEVRELRFVSAQRLTWSTPLAPGGVTLVYDTLRSALPDGHETDAVCVESDDGTDLLADDSQAPVPGAIAYYLVRAENDCPAGTGPLGRNSDGVPRPGRACP